MRVAVRGQAAILVFGTHLIVTDNRIRLISSSFGPRRRIVASERNERLPFFHEPRGMSVECFLRFFGPFAHGGKFV
jgi:hypothetical protein